MKQKTRYAFNNQKCEKCNYEWFSRVEKPKQCPKCKSMKWFKKKVGLLKAK